MAMPVKTKTVLEGKEWSSTIAASTRSQPASSSKRLAILKSTPLYKLDANREGKTMCPRKIAQRVNQQTEKLLSAGFNNSIESGVWRKVLL